MRIRGNRLLRWSLYHIYVWYSQMSDWTNGAAGAGVTGLVLGLGYAAIKLLKRSRCASHTGCCELDISRAETERQAHEDMRSTVLEVLKEHLGPAKKIEDVRLDVLSEPGAAALEESKDEGFVQYHVPPSAM